MGKTSKHDLIVNESDLWYADKNELHPIGTKIFMKRLQIPRQILNLLTTFHNRIMIKGCSVISSKISLWFN